MSLHKEISFEDELCNHLESAGWIYGEGGAARYDRERALLPEDLRNWLQETRRSGKLWKRRTIQGHSMS